MEERGKVQGVFSAVWGISSIVGPLVGGAIVEVAPWPWVFYVNLPFGVIAMTIIAMELHEAPHGAGGDARATAAPGRAAPAALGGPLPSTPLPRFDWAGTMLLAAFVTLGILATRADPAGRVWLPLPDGDAIAIRASRLALAAAILAVGLLVVEWHAAAPIIPLGPWRTPIYGVGVVVGVIGAVALFAGTNYVPLFLQAVRGCDPTQAGAALTPFSLGWVTASVLAGRALARSGFRPFVWGGSLALLAGSGMLARLTPETTYAYVCVAMVVMGIGMGWTMPVLLIAIQNAAAPRERGTMTATLQFYRTMGGAFGMALLGASFVADLHSRATPEQWSRLHDLVDPARIAAAKVEAADVPGTTAAPSRPSNRLPDSDGGEAQAAKEGVARDGTADGPTPEDAAARALLTSGLARLYTIVAALAALGLLASLAFPKGTARELAHEGERNESAEGV